MFIKNQNSENSEAKTMQLFSMSQIWYILRMIIASLCGILIGLERKNRSKEAGVRTHCVVACASALMMIISKYSFGDMAIGADGVRGADGARIAAQVVSGIGFLGAGMIFVHRNTVTGLTTAAGIWATAGVGLAIGAGLYVVGIAAAVIIIIAQILLHKNFGWLKSPKLKRLVIRDVDTEGYSRYMTQRLAEHGVAVHDVSIEKNDGRYTYTFIIEVPQDTDEESIISPVEYKCKISADL